MSTINIQYTNKLTAKDGIKTLVYGPSGVGKTCTIATAPNPFIFSAEKGLLSLRKLNIPYVDISTYKELVEAFRWLFTSNEVKKYDTLGLDSLSDISEVILSEEMKKVSDGRQAHGKTQQWVGDLMRSFRDIKGKNAVIIAKQVYIQDGMIQKAVPLMPNKTMIAQIPYYWDLVLHMHIWTNPEGTQSARAFHTQDGAYWSAKDRSGNLAELEDVNLTKLFHKAAA